jgi:hypothetical protein
MQLMLAVALAAVVAQATPVSPSAGDVAFAKGDFKTAFTEYNDAVAANPSDPNALLGLGTLDLYRNDWRNARTYLNRARHLAPSDGRIAARLETLEARLPKPGRYVFDLTSGQTDIPLVAVDPVPVVRATIDGRTFTFIVDTGATSIDLTPQAAQVLGVADGGTIDRIAFPGLTVDNVGASVLSGPLSAGTLPVDGSIGTVFLSHWIPTFDYAHSRLHLRLWEASPELERTAKSEGAAIEQMWLIGDHLLVASTRIGAGRGAQFAIETGESNGTVALADATEESFTLPLVSLGKYAQGPVSAVALPDELFRAVPFRVAGALHSGFFRPATLTLDFAAMNIIVSK